MVKNSTDYYRKNRRDRRIVYQCPHCPYHTYNCKGVILNHINSKHETESNRPYQCTECDRGFAQKADLIRHLKHEHKLSGNPVYLKVSTLLYIIAPTNTLPKSKKTKARRDYYLANPVLKSRDIFNKHHEYLPNCFLKNHDLHYDRRNEYITFHTLALKEGFNILDKPQIVVAF